VGDPIVIKTIKSFLKGRHSSPKPQSGDAIFMSTVDDSEPKVLKTEEADDDKDDINLESPLAESLTEGSEGIKADEVEGLVSKSAEPADDPELEELKNSSGNKAVGADSESEENDSSRSKVRPARSRSRRKSDSDDKDQPANRRSKKNFSLGELLEQEVPVRASVAGDKLRISLTGSIVVQIDGKKQRHVYDWSASELQSEVTEEDQRGDCLIRVSEENIMRISRGELNPQIAMLTDKIKVEGKNELAIYFFNLIAPRDAV